MIFCNLKVLLAQRNITISKMSEDTHISRTTLTSLCTNKSGGIQFDTLDTICGYLNVLPTDVILFSPYLLEASRDDRELYIKVINLLTNKRFTVEFAIDLDEKYHQLEFSYYLDRETQYQELKRIISKLPKYYISQINQQVNDLLCDLYKETKDEFPFSLETSI